ncbi:Protein of unknown function [Pseudorhodobacter antarcticus]|jgi:hypothetical protein|uniref:DUF2927 domain-containing protein n=1 Tax=Pseudorhodobacter antarcticus TaxID=1077947 RepID=A0A1H8CMY0_9RHOB|nr:DUF2927 domain-containing protein [Pseudorhodobacter antarcticus]SEM96346.1 Protein of unknown function [Pseudorhodobacter antarcticus]
MRAGGQGLWAKARKGVVLVATSAALLSACATPPTLQGRATQPPPQRIAAPIISAVPSAQSTALRAYYADVQAQLLAQGLMRTDDGATDAPFSARQLANNFIRIAFFDEFDSSSGTLVARATEKRLRRWDKPLRVGLTFGSSIPKTKRATETARIRSFLNRLSKLTGHPIALATTNINFSLNILNTDEIQALGPTIRRTDPDIGAPELDAIVNMPQSTYCQVTTSINDDTNLIERAFAVIRAEHPDLLHLSCLHEEIAQGLGLPNDSPAARPSIFNDDQEFALLTPMDEMMLKMLYNPALTPGMTADQARPIIDQLATALVGGDS